MLGVKEYTVHTFVEFMSLGLMSPSALCCSRPYVVWVNVSFGFTSLVLMSFVFVEKPTSRYERVNVSFKYVSFGLIMLFCLL